MKIPQGLRPFGIHHPTERLQTPEQGEVKTKPSKFVSRNTKTSILETFRAMRVLKKRKALEEGLNLNARVRYLTNKYKQLPFFISALDAGMSVRTEIFEWLTRLSAIL